MEHVEINFLDISENDEYKTLAKEVIDTCFKEEGLENSKLYVDIIFTNPKNIKQANAKYRKIDKETDVLSFPMFERDEIKTAIKSDSIDTLGDIMISIERVEEQAKEYGHSIERELAYMIVHGFYHLMGYDHMEDAEKKEMREKEEVVLNKLKIWR